MQLHPQGSYCGLINEYRPKKSLQYAIELFDLTNTNNFSVPHQQIHINRDIIEVNSLYWEPNHNKLAVLTLSVKKNDGKAQYTVASNRSGLDIYEMVHDK